MTQKTYGQMLIGGSLLVVLVVVLLLCTGCTSPLADASFAVQRDFHFAVTSFGLVAQDFKAKATIMANTKHQIQRKLQAVELAMAYDRAKDADGNLVLSPEEFAELTAVIIEGQHAVVTSQSSWEKVSSKFQETVVLLQSINTSTMTTAEAIHKTEKSVQALTNQVVQVLGGLIAGVVVAF